jgi:hypothetical protein
MKDELDYTEEYKKQVRPAIIRRVRNIFLSLLACVIILMIVSKVIDFLKLPFEIFFVFAFSCGVFYLYHIFSLLDTPCPHCKKPLFALFSIKGKPIIWKFYVSRHCPHCGARLR